jgi:hypothetical protein
MALSLAIKPRIHLVRDFNSATPNGEETFFSLTPNHDALIGAVSQAVIVAVSIAHAPHNHRTEEGNTVTRVRIYERGLRSPKRRGRSCTCWAATGTTLTGMESNYAIVSN